MSNLRGSPSRATTPKKNNKKINRGACGATTTQRTGCNPLVCTNVLRAKDDFLTLTRLLDRRSTRNNKSDGLLEPTLDLRAQRRPKHDARFEGDDLHRHVRAALLRSSRWRRVRPQPVRLAVRHLRFAQECFGEGVER